MRIWHQSLIPYLPSVKDYKGCSNQLGGQHTEIRMILFTIMKHGRVNHSTVSYVNKHPIHYLKAYGLLIIAEMQRRGFNMSQEIINEYMSDSEAVSLYNSAKAGLLIYPEHDTDYLGECLDNLRGKGIVLVS